MAHGRSCMAVLCTLAVVLGVPVAGQLSSPAPSSARAAQRSGVPPRAHKHYFPDAKYPAFNWVSTSPLPLTETGSRRLTTTPSDATAPRSPPVCALRSLRALLAIRIYWMLV